MDFRYLSAAQMAGLTDGLLKDQGAALASHPQLAWMIPNLAAAHGRILALKDLEKSEYTLSSLTAALEEQDGLFDERVRTMWYALEAAWRNGQCKRPMDDDRQKRLLAARDRLLPEGLYTTRRDYSHEVDLCRHAAAALDAPMRALLASVHVDDTHALAVTEAWIGTGDTLGELLRQRDLLQAGVAQAQGLKEAKADWSEAVNLMLDVLDRGGLAQDVVVRLKAPFTEAVERDHERRQRRAHEDEGARAHG